MLCVAGTGFGSQILTTEEDIRPLPLMSDADDNIKFSKHKEP